MSVEPWSAEAFEQRYQGDADPWDFAGSPYEQGRYASILASLGRPSYGRAYEPGCSVGELTALLAPRCAELVATDVSATAVDRARARCRDLAGVTLATGSVTDAPPAPLDLVVLSEVGYYLSTVELAEVAGALGAALAPGGELVACHWLGESPDHQLHGTTVHRVLADSLPSRLARTRHVSAPGFTIDRWTAS
ncbi:nodulation S family protein [Aquihabitans sp. G128]|uniref:SAM-dependent methyltransferase n=1 Tax=Aquihabitans sp. G128 TaxID=2849779 RepID=UPI001C22E035|nr:SAM-dependent methyltransferase [Aquihabitans sp. G128]QXC62213.1 nodulation S family protein [Aquihabitans sp. G128]